MTNQVTYSFLQGGGEMGEFIRKFDWSRTSLGTPDTWPQSLRTTLSIVLTSKFPMFLYWSDDLICFYNDAFRPSFGISGKHPYALGRKGPEVWEEIWPTISPMIESIRNGESSIWKEDLLLPIYRNNQIEEVYWTFSYSPVQAENGKIEGVLAVCSETTEKRKVINQEVTESVQVRKKVDESEQQLRSIVDNAPFPIAVYIGREMRIQLANQNIIDVWGKGPDVMGKLYSEILPELGRQEIFQ